MTSNIVPNNSQSPFDAIRHFDEHGNEFWIARELMSLMGYPRWAEFQKPISQAIENLDINGDIVSDHFSGLTLKSSGRNGFDYRMTRYAAYMTALCCDGRKPQVASAKKYFATKTREAEVVIPAQNDRLRELELMLALANAEKESAIAQKNLLDTRHMIVQTCPLPVQQKVLGYTEIKTVEYIDRCLLNDQFIKDGTTLNKTALCKRYGFLTKKGKPDYSKLNKCLEAAKLPSHAWKLTASIQENEELNREYLSDLDDAILNGDRQLWMGE